MLAAIDQVDRLRVRDGVEDGNDCGDGGLDGAPWPHELLRRRD